MPRTPDPHSTPSRPPSSPLPLSGDAALDLLIANTGPGQNVIDFDNDPVLRAAANTTGRRYRALPRQLQTPSSRPERTADLAVLAWPRPDAPDPTAARNALATAAAALAANGQVAVLLEPTLSQPYTITWVGAVLAAARAVGLDYLQDVVCLHTPTDTRAPDRAGTAAASRTGQHHRVVLVLRPQAGRHV